MKKKTTRKLSLHTETLKSLTALDLQRAGGGYDPQLDYKLRLDALFLRPPPISHPQGQC